MHTPNYYRKVLKRDWPGLDQQAEFLKSYCDSQLEIFFGLCLCGRYHEAAAENGLITYERVHCESQAMVFSEPFGCSPTSNGASIAFLEPQHLEEFGLAWDFCFHTGDDNGLDYFDDRVNPAYLIEVDGYGIHKHQRDWDLEKLRRTNLPAIRVREEAFPDLWTAADAVLRATIWHTGSSPHPDLITNFQPEEVAQ